MKRIKYSNELNVIKFQNERSERNKNSFVNVLCVLGLILAICAGYYAVKGI